MKKLNHSEAGKLGFKASRATVEKQKKERRKQYLKNPSRCLKCNTLISYEKRKQTFCSHSCSASYRNKGVSRHGNTPFNCRVCDKRLHQSSRKYCSHKCYQLAKWENTKAKIKNGEIQLTDNRRPLAKKFLKSEYGEQCSICKRTKWMGQPIPLVLDHIDGHHENNELENLRLVCGNCDMQLPTYKSKNKGNGRKYRRN